MTMIRRALRDNGAAALVSMSAVSSTLLLLGHVTSGIVSLRMKLLFVVFIDFALLYPLQCIMVGKRRCSGHWLIQYSAMAAYYLHTPLTFYATNAVCATSTSHFDESFPLCFSTGAALILVAMNHTLSPTRAGPFIYMRAYSLHDGPHDDPWRFVLSVVYLACVEWEWTRISSANRGLVLKIVHDMSPDLEWARNNRGLVPLLFNMSPHLLLLLIFLFAASKPRESTLDYETKAVADYMKRESKSSSPFFDDGGLQLDCCRYPFTQRRKDGRWISIKDLLQQDDLSTEDKDIWLSCSLCRLLARRYYGFHCAEEGDVKVRRFALEDLQGTTDDGGYKRAFTIVEVQLAFLHDYFFTTSLRIMESSFYVLPHKMQKSAEWLSMSYIMNISLLAAALADQNFWIPKPLTTTRSYEPSLICYAVTTVICVPNILVLTPPERHLAIYWRPMHIIFHKFNLLRDPTPTVSIWLRFLSICVRFIRRIYHHSRHELDDVHRPSQQLQTSIVYWRDKIGQYSLLLDYDRRCSRKKALVAWFLRLVRPQPWYRFIKHLPVEEDVRVPDSVRKLVAETLMAIDGPPTNGTRSLKINMDSAGYDWSWTCRQETHTATILIWHIATCYCDMSSLTTHSGQPEDFPLIFHDVATTLSRYCAYLVAFLPEFLPEHILITKEVFQNVIQDAHRALGLTLHMEEKEKCTKIQGLSLRPRCGQTTIHKGIMLGRQLEKLDTRLRWKVMAEFWAETILYVAPSDNAELHIEYLAKGGQFITHLWAMLSNAGILKRATGEWHPPPASTTKRGPPKKIETTKATRTQECPF